MVRGLRIPVFRTKGKDPTPADLERDINQESPKARSPNAFSSRGFISGTMIGTDEITLVLGKKTVIYPVHGYRKMTTLIDISKDLAVIADKDSLNSPPLTAQGEFLCCPMGKLIGAAHRLTLLSRFHSILSIGQLGQEGQIPLRAPDHDLPPIDQDRKPVEREPLTGTVDA